MPLSDKLLEQIKQLIPPLTGKLHKGQSGRVAVVGGAEEYTGAPFFASMSALRVGADLSHVLCAPSAAGPIKSYSPDLIVHPIFAHNATTASVRGELEALFPRLHVMVLGPGLGRSDSMQTFARLALSMARERGLYVVLDADALFMLQKSPESIRGYSRAVLTPNVVEFGRLCDALGVPKDAMKLSASLGGVTVLQKGAADLAAYADEQAEVDVTGALKRCGGQGDVLSGAVATFLAWGETCDENGNVEAKRIPFLAALGGALLTRTAARKAFEKHGRALVTQDILQEVGPAFAELFEEEGKSIGKL